MKNKENTLKFYYEYLYFFCRNIFNGRQIFQSLHCIRFLLILLIFFSLSNSILWAKPKYKKVIKFWHHTNHPSELEILNKYIKKYNSLYPDVKIQSLSFDFAVYRNSLKSNLMKKNGPDIFLIPNDWLGDLIVNNLVQHLSMIGIKTDDWIESCKKQAVVNNLIYGLPLSTETIALFYNKKLVKTPPVLFDEFVRMLNDLKPSCYPLSVDVNSAYYLIPWYFGFGGKLLKNGMLNIEKDIFIKTCNFWIDLNYKKKLMYPITSFEYKTVLNNFAAGNLAFLVDGPWSIPYLKSAKTDFGITTLPYNAETKLNISPFIGTQIYCVSSQSKITVELKEFLNIMTSHDIQIEFARKLGKLPACNSIYNKFDKKKDWMIFAFYNQLKKGASMPSSSEIDKLWSVLSQDNLINIFNKKETPENFVKKHKDFFK